MDPTFQERGEIFCGLPTFRLRTKGLIEPFLRANFDGRLCVEGEERGN